MTTSPNEHLRDCAWRLVLLLDARDLNRPALKETVARLGPYINEALGQQKELPSLLQGLPFRLAIHELTVRHRRDAELKTAMEDFEKAMSVISKPSVFSGFLTREKK